MVVVMVRIPVGSAQEGERLAERFKNREGLVDNQPGYQGFELLKGDGEYISVTRWASKEALENWMSSQAHGQAHAGTRPPTGGGHPAGEGTMPGAQAQGGMQGSTMIYEVVIPGEGQA